MGRGARLEQAAKAPQTFAVRRPHRAHGRLARGEKRCLAGKIIRPILTAVWLVLLVSMMVMPRLHPDALAIDAGEAPLPTLSSFATFPVDETDDRYELTLDETHDLLAPERTACESKAWARSTKRTTTSCAHRGWPFGWQTICAGTMKGVHSCLFSKHTRELTKLALPEDLDASMARCYQDQYGAYRLLLQKGKKLLSVTLWWPKIETFPAGHIARTLLEGIS